MERGPTPCGIVYVETLSLKCIKCLVPCGCYSLRAWVASFTSGAAPCDELPVFQDVSISSSLLPRYISKPQ
ncbi:hypothetical protein EMCRGX_G026252 [Ephydatia muelleri]